MKIPAGALAKFGAPGSADRGLETETSATIRAAGACGVQFPGGMTKAAILTSLAWPFMPEEIPPVGFSKDLNSEAKRYIAQVVQPNLIKGARQGDQNTLNLAHQIGRYMAAGLAEGRLFSPHPPIEFGANSLKVDGKQVPYEIQTGEVVEFGMGINGLISHLANVKAGRYSATGVHRSKAEVRVLEGVAEYNKLAAPALSFTDRGIGAAISEMTENEGNPGVDVVVASRVHSAGKELLIGMKRVGGILRDGGIVIARGPQRARQGVGYNDVSSALKRNPQLRIIENHTYNARLPRGGQEPNRLVIAQKI